MTFLKKIMADDKPFVDDDDEDDTWDDEKLKEAIQFMKDSGLVPKGTGKPTKPNKDLPHDVAYDKDLDIHYLIVYSKGSHGGDVWIIDDSGQATFVSSFQGDFKPQQGVKIYKAGRYRDYMSLKAIQKIFSIVDPSWDEDEEKEGSLH